MRIWTIKTSGRKDNSRSGMPALRKRFKYRSRCSGPAILGSSFLRSMQYPELCVGCVPARYRHPRVALTTVERMSPSPRAMQQGLDREFKMTQELWRHGLQTGLTQALLPRVFRVAGRHTTGFHTRTGDLRYRGVTRATVMSWR